MLERIDEQTAAMSQRSERLKMMKLQYQMYFTKLVQHQTLRSIQQTTTAMPVMLQPQPQPTAAAAAMSTPTAATAAAGQPSGSQPLQQWAYPAQPGMMLAPQFAPQPMYMPMPVPDLYGGVSLGGGQALGTSNLFDLRATLRALDNENADLPERMTHFDAAARSTAGEYHQAADRTTTPTATSTTPCSPTRDKSARELSSTSSTLATSSLTFDKLPKTATLTELTEAPAAAAAAIAAVVDDVGGRPQMTGLRRGSQQQQQQQPMEQHEDGWPNSRVTKVEHEKSPSVAGHNEPGQQQQHNFEAYFGELKIDEPWQPAATTTTAAARPRELLFEDKPELNVRATGGAGSGAATLAGVGVGLVGGISNDLLDEVKASRAALQKAAAAVDEQLARGNQLSPTATSNASNNNSNNSNGNEAAAKPRVSIENIENAIYGERLTGSATATATATAAATAAAAAAATSAAAAAATPTLGLFDNAAQLQEQELSADNTHDGAQIDYGQYDAISYGGDTGEPSYASIEQQQQQQQLPLSVAGEPLYSEIGNPTDYQPYAADASGAVELSPAAAAAAATGEEPQQQQQQEYSNMDYSNYDATQYAAGYDPNAYPGYIYDEASGQYIADPNAAQYAPDGGYAAQDYDAGAANYDYYGEQQQQQQPQQEQQEQQQQQQEQQQEVAYPMSENNSEAGESLVPQEVELAAPPASSAPADGVDAKSEATPAPTPAPASAKPVKPTSILASTDKQAAPNDAHQQQPQQQQQAKKKKRVNFVDSSETDESSSAKPVQQETPTPTPNSNSGSHPPAAAAATPPLHQGSESDFDFSTGSEAKN
ncbi:hypothetical protein KR093_008011 [Drosophila rubida]|uniref:RNA polymerase II degradation factor 1 n=1 Tax=Drosophila rubida TaxID=30044 RepID=A0AAD4KCC5_9MUSC|nr:hypothetical protein KR093_008011 [Drosophila rubida]